MSWGLPPPLAAVAATIAARNFFPAEFHVAVTLQDFQVNIMANTSWEESATALHSDAGVRLQYLQGPACYMLYERIAAARPYTDPADES